MLWHIFCKFACTQESPQIGSLWGTDGIYDIVWFILPNFNFLSPIIQIFFKPFDFIFNKTTIFQLSYSNNRIKSRNTRTTSMSSFSSFIIFHLVNTKFRAEIFFSVAWLHIKQYISLFTKDSTYWFLTTVSNTFLTVSSILIGLFFCIGTNVETFHS